MRTINLNRYVFLTGILLALSIILIGCGSDATATSTARPTVMPAPTSRPEIPVAQLRPARATVASANLFQLTILHNNDGESQLIDLGPGLEEFGGIARFVSVVVREKEAAGSGAGSVRNRGVIMVSSGDNFLAGPEFTVGWRAGTFYDALALDLIGYDAIALGNHDFDLGPDVLADFIRQVSKSQSTFLSSNLDFSGEPALRELFDQGRIAESVVPIGELAGVVHGPLVHVALQPPIGVSPKLANLA